MGKLFGTDGIRGVANVYPMTAEMAVQIGRAIAHISKTKNHRHRIVIGKDTRLSGYMLESALTAGICSMGVDVLLVGPMPTPGIAFITNNMCADAGMIISASHNPFQDNGIKIFSREGFKLPDKQEAKIEELIFSKSIDSLRPTACDLGKAFRIEDALGRYIVFLKNTFPKELSLEGIKIVIDCGNGATYKVAPTIFNELGAETITVNANPNGENINLNCGSLYPRELAKEVLRRKANVGLAFDGDGDRLIAVDEKGNIVNGDQIITICAYLMKKEGRLKNNVLVTTVMSNLGLSLTLKELGINHFTTNVGDRYVLEEMIKRNAVLGGEDSGHLIFLEYHTTGDAIITALQLLRALLKEKRSLGDFSKMMKIFPQITINVEVKRKPDLNSEPEIMRVIKKVENELANQGRVLVRYSGTQSLCRVMVEGSTQEKSEYFAKKIAQVVELQLS